MLFLQAQDEKSRGQVEDLEEKMADILVDALFSFLKRQEGGVSHGKDEGKAD